MAEPQPVAAPVAALTVTDLNPAEQLVLHMARELIREGRDLPLQVGVTLANALDRTGRGAAVLRGMAAERERECRRLVAAMHARAAEWEDRSRRLRSNSGPESAASADLYEVLAAELRELADDPGGAGR